MNVILRLLSLFALSTCFLSLKAQTLLYGPTVSYQYQKGSTLKLGGNVMTPAGFNSTFRTDLTANLTWTQSKFAVIPELAFSYYFGSSRNMNLFPFFARAELTPYTVTPKVGLSLFTVVDLDLGYGISFNEKRGYRPIDGFTASLRFSFPLNL